MLKSAFRFIIQTILLPLKILPYIYLKLSALGKVEWLKVNLTGKLDEHPPAVGFASWFKPMPKKFYQLTMQLNQLEQNVHKLKLKEVTLSIHGPKLGWARAWELKQSLENLRQAGVNVRANLLSGDVLSYYLALSAQEIFIPPALTLDLLGFRIESLYFKELFDKWRIRPNFIHVGNFKSAAERFTQKKGSPYAKKQLAEILSNLQAHVSETIEASRSEKLAKTLAKNPLDKSQARAPITAQEALKLGLVDGVCYEKQVLSYIAAGLGRSTPEKILDLDRALVKLNRKRQKLYNLKKRKRVALIVADGPIIDSKDPAPSAISYQDYHSAFAQVKNGHYDAVILRINSPGGSALVSDLLWQDLMSVKAQGLDPYFEDSDYLSLPSLEESEEQKSAREQAEKKAKKKEKKSKRKGKKSPGTEIFVSQSDIAASGGYYLSAICENVFASPLTITGSIGVVGGKFNMAGFAKKLGITLDVVESGSNGSLYSPFKDFTPAQKKTLAASMNQMYDLFRHRIATGRGMADETIKKLGSGRVYSGKVALENGLVDKQGGLIDTIKGVKNHFNLKADEHLEVEVYPRIKASLLPKSGLLPGIFARLKHLTSLNTENIFFLDEDLF